MNLLFESCDFFGIWGLGFGIYQVVPINPQLVTKVVIPIGCSYKIVSYQNRNLCPRVFDDLHFSRGIGIFCGFTFGCSGTSFSRPECFFQNNKGYEGDYINQP